MSSDHPKPFHQVDIKLEKKSYATEFLLAEASSLLNLV